MRTAREHVVAARRVGIVTSGHAAEDTQFVGHKGRARQQFRDRIPGTGVAIGPNSPRTSAGASGFGSQVECCGGPPIRNRTMQAFARPKAVPPPTAPF